MYMSNDATLLIWMKLIKTGITRRSHTTHNRLHHQKTPHLLQMVMAGNGRGGFEHACTNCHVWDKENKREYVCKD